MKYLITHEHGIEATRSKKEAMRLATILFRINPRNTPVRIYKTATNKLIHTLSKAKE